MERNRLGRPLRTPIGVAALALLSAGLPAVVGAQQTVIDTTRAAADSARAVIDTTAAVTDTTRAPAPVLAPASSTAVSPAEGTVHTVKRGDTLWDIAGQYLRDPFQWPTIYRMNGDVVENPHWIYPGERIRIVPGERPATVADVTVSGPAPDSTLAAADSVVEPLTEPEPPTRFGVQRNASGDELVSPMQRLAPAAINQGDFIAAPWVGPEGGPGGGRLVGAAEPSALRSAAERWVQLNEDVYLELPDGSDATPGTRYLLYELGTKIHKVGQVVRPTGIAEVEDARPGQAARARIVRQFQAIALGQRLIPLDTIVVRREQPQPLAGGPSTRVIWADDDPLPT
ncbi:MAG TPA: LysM peptidoglycan-binding domain-containing protein, partial [Gemmatimonadaceae bacterium]|nr:LysM peptidoglycan-binding domain-containing protein [Gemmatimonadaceae bacterium]